MRLLLALTFLVAPLIARADSATVATASNFAGTAEALAADYGRASGHQITIVAGATGKLYAQITQGAPFDLFLAADRATPSRLAAKRLALAGTQASYAKGRLVLWTPDPARDLSDPVAALQSASHIAIANPDLAPYGRAAVETMAALGLNDALAGRIVTAENIGQAQTLAASGAAELAFVAASGLIAGPGGARWDVPSDLHGPILQDGVLLGHGAANAAAKGFLAYLNSAPARALIAAAGYDLP